MTAVQFTVPGPPVPWMRAASRAGVRFTPAKQRGYQRLVADVARTALHRSPRWPLDARYRVDCSATFADARRRDLDNSIKTALDALSGVTWRDDSQVDEMHVYRLRGVPSLHMTITVLGATQ